MIDHLICCATAEEAQTFIKRFGASRAHRPLIVVREAELDESNPLEPVVLSPAVIAPGFYLWIALDALDESLRDLPGDACRIIADWNAYAAGEPYVLHMSPVVTLASLQSYRIEPMPAGRAYSWEAR